MALMPIFIFFGVYKYQDIYWATAAGIIAYGIQILYLKKTGALTKMEIITFWMFLVFGGLTIIFRNEAFLQWKLTILSIAFGVALLVAKKYFKKNLIKSVVDTLIDSANKQAEAESKKTNKEAKPITFSLSDKSYNYINNVWAYSFLIKGVVNYYVAEYYSLDDWVNYKTFGIAFITLFVLGMTISCILKEKRESKIIQNEK